jgi:acyl-CoA thioesterase FadM
MKPIPIHYKISSEIRFSDFDVNGHLYSAKYIDIVVSSRFRFFESHFGQKIDIFSEKSIGLVITSLEIFWFLR